MTRTNTRRSSPCSIVISAFGATLVSIAIAWSATSAPIVIPERPSAVQTTPYQSPSRDLYRLSPIPPGADWTA
jgi:hypothetical protein